MKRQYKYFIIIIILLQLTFAGCGGLGTGEGLGFKTIEEFKENFAEFMAQPSYIPFEFDKESEFKSYGATYNKKGFEEKRSLVRNIKKIYKRIDIFYRVDMEYSVGVSENELTEDQIYKLTEVQFLYFPSTTLEECITDQNLELLKHEEHSFYYGEYFESELFYPEKTYLKNANWMNLLYYTSLDDRVYAFSIQYAIKEGTNKEKFLELRDKLKTEALPEVIKSYESLKYENKD